MEPGIVITIPPQYEPTIQELDPWNQVLFETHSNGETTHNFGRKYHSLPILDSVSIPIAYKRSLKGSSIEAGLGALGLLILFGLPLGIVVYFGVKSLHD